MAMHIASLTRGTVDAAHRVAKMTDHAVTLILDDTHQKAIVLPSGRVTVREER